LALPQPFYRWRPHPWHGLDPGPDPPWWIRAYVELTPFDLVKYEIDKVTGYLKVDRPQRSSSLPPTLYGFVPQTFCGERVNALCPRSNRGDGDPLDVCIVCERPIGRAEVILEAVVVGGLQMVDHGEADDKIIAVLRNDNLWGEVEDVSELPEVLVERMRHYFLTYKMIPGKETDVSIDQVYGRAHALEVVSASIADYRDAYGDP